MRRFTELRAWQACNAYKKAIYRLCENGALSKDLRRRSQLEEAVKGPTDHVAEGFGRLAQALGGNGFTRPREAVTCTRLHAARRMRHR